MKFGAIDIGTNAVRLLIGEVSESKGAPFIKKASYIRIPLRLGIDVFENGIISDGKIVELQKTIQSFKLISQVFNVVDLRTCATSAMREADNGDEVRRYIHHMTGVDIEIISGEEEAKLILSNFLMGKYKVSDDFIVIDIGGGSTEISVFNKGELSASSSFGLGTIRLLKSKVDKNEWKRSKDWIGKNIRISKGSLVFVTGGNINRVHKLLGKKSSEGIGIVEFEEFSNKILKMTPSERTSEYKLSTDRAEVIGPACEICHHLFDAIGCKNINVPRIGLSDGMIHKLHKKHQRHKVLVG